MNFIFFFGSFIALCKTKKTDRYFISQLLKYHLNFEEVKNENIDEFFRNKYPVGPQPITGDMTKRPCDLDLFNDLVKLNNSRFSLINHNPILRKYAFYSHFFDPVFYVKAPHNLLYRDLNELIFFQEVPPLDFSTDYSCSDVFELEGDFLSSFKSHYQILLRSKVFLRELNKGINNQDRDILKLFKRILDLKKSQFGTFSEFKEDVMTNLSYVLIETLRTDWIRENIPEKNQYPHTIADPSAISRLKLTEGSRYRPPCSNSDFIYDHLMLENLNFDHINNVLSTPFDLELKIKKIGEIVIINNQKRKKFRPETILRIKNKNYHLIGGVRRSFTALNAKFFYANVIEPKIGNIISVSSYMGNTKKTFSYENIEDQNLDFDHLYFEENDE